MSEEMKKKGEALMEAFDKLPNEKKEYLLGFAVCLAEVNAEQKVQKERTA